VRETKLEEERVKMYYGKNWLILLSVFKHWADSCLPTVPPSGYMFRISAS